MCSSARLTDAVDVALDRLVAPGYSSIGYAVRRNGWPADLPVGAVSGRVAVVTGGSSGLGLAAATKLARLGARVHLVVRDRDKGENARQQVLSEVRGAQVCVWVCDVANLSDVRRFAAEFDSAESRVDVVVHNAGVLPAERNESPEAHEIALATHVLGPYLLTGLLKPRLAAASHARVIFVSSGGMYTQPLRTDDPEYRNDTYRGATAYARTKRMQVVLAAMLADRLRGEGIGVHSMHPGWAATEGLARSLPVFARLVGPLLRTPAQGADTVVWLAATEPAPPSGHFWHDRRSRPEHYLPTTRDTPEQRRDLWEYCCAATGMHV